jgi:hypothetical protein
MLASVRWLEQGSATTDGAFWQWNLAAVANLLVAAATIGLAAYTASMARATRKLAEETQTQIDMTNRAVIATERQAELNNEQVAISRRASIAAQEPVIADANPAIDRNTTLTWDADALHDSWESEVQPEQSVSVSYRCTIRNIGNGPARLGAINLFPGLIQLSESPPQVGPHVSVLACGDSEVLTFVAERGSRVFEAFANGGQLSLVVHYEDLAGNAYQTNFDVTEPPDANRDWAGRPLRVVRFISSTTA